MRSSSFTSCNIGASSDLYRTGEFGKQATCKPCVGWCAQHMCGLTYRCQGLQMFIGVFPWGRGRRQRKEGVAGWTTRLLHAHAPP